MSMNELQNLLDEGVKNGVFPGYAAAVGRGDEVWFASFGGNRCLLPNPLPMVEDALFDMASLSKLMGTTMAALRLIEQGKVSLQNTLGDFFPHCYGKQSITIQNLMTHTSGIKAHFPLWLRGIDPADATEEILREPLAIPTGTDVIYSCMGYILLGKIMEKIQGEPLDAIVRRLVFDPLGMHSACYCPSGDKICVSTEGETNGVVHDENAAFLHGISANAGVFCDLADGIRFASMLSRKGEGYLERATFDMAIQNYTPGMDENRGLGFQHISFGYGHNGFTGTSMYVNKDGVYALLFTNRVHPTRANGLLPAFRKQFHQLTLG